MSFANHRAQHFNKRLRRLHGEKNRAKSAVNLVFSEFLCKFDQYLHLNT